MRSRSYVWWPGLDEQLEAVVSECRCCLAVRNSPAVLKDSTWPTPQTPWERLHADFAGPIDPGRKMLLVMADASTKWPEIFLMDTTTSARTIEKLRTVFARFGIPKTVVSDNGAQFTSKEFQEFMSSNGIQHRMGAGLTERFSRTSSTNGKKGVKEDEGRTRITTIEAVKVPVQLPKHTAPIHGKTTGGDAHRSPTQITSRLAATRKENGRWKTHSSTICRKAVGDGTGLQTRTEIATWSHRTAHWILLVPGSYR